MSMTLIPVPFWVADMEVKEVTEATYKSDFNINKLNDLGQRLNFSSLYQIQEYPNEYILEMQNREFIRFKILS